MARRRRVRATLPPPDTDAAARHFGLAFRDPALLSRALVHRSATGLLEAPVESNERLEFLGDRVLGLLMVEWLLERFPSEQEGTLMRRFGTLVAADALARIAERIGIGAHLVVATDGLGPGIASRENVRADALEAVLGALYLDGGLDAARPFLRRIFAPEMDGAPPHPPLPAKSRLQEWLQGRGLGLPQYRLVSSTGPSHAPLFVVTVAAAGREAEGAGDTKRAAEQAAAEAWLAGAAP